MNEIRRLEMIRKFNTYHRENPHVWKLFERFALEATRSGRNNFSIGAVCERVRWETNISTKDPDGFKINNNHRAFYARMFMKTHRRFDGFIHNGKFFDGFFRLKPSIADSAEDLRRRKLPKGKDKDLPDWW